MGEDAEQRVREAEARGDLREAARIRNGDSYKVPRMVIFQGWKEPYDQPRTTYPKGRGYRAGGHYYTCKHHDSATGNCRDYQNRPRMCSDFPYGRACPYDDCQAPEHGRFEHLFAPGRIPPVAVVERVYGHRALPVIVDANKAP